MKSSVELFAIALYEGGLLQGNGDEINALLEQHKAMHKEEIVKGVDFGINQWGGWDSLNGEQYYNETYGGNK